MTTQDEWDGLVNQLADASMQAKATLAEVRSELKEARRVIRELKAEIANASTVEVNDRLEAAVEAGLEEYGRVIRKAMDDAVDKVGAEFDRLFNTYMTGRPSGHGDESLEELLKRRRG